MTGRRDDGAAPAGSARFSRGWPPTPRRRDAARSWRPSRASASPLWRLLPRRRGAGPRQPSPAPPSVEAAQRTAVRAGAARTGGRTRGHLPGARPRSGAGSAAHARRTRRSTTFLALPSRRPRASAVRYRIAGQCGPARTAAWKSSAGAPGCRGRRRVGTQGGRPAGVDPETSPRPPARRRPAEDPGQVIAPPRAGRFRRRRSRSSRSHTMTGRMPGRARPRPPPRAFPSAAAALTGGTPRIPAALSVVPRPIAPLLRRGARAERGETGNTGGRPGPPARPRALSGGGCRGRGLPGSRAARSRPITRRATSESSRLWWRAYAASGRAPRPRRSPLPRRPRPWPGPGRPGC